MAAFETPLLVQPAAAGAMRVGFLTIAPSPYIQDLFRVIAADGRISPTVFFQEPSSPAFDWKASELPDYWVLLPSRTVNVMGARLFVSLSAIRTIAKGDYDAFVVGGYASLTSQRLIRWLHRKQIPWVFWGEIPGYQNRGRIGRIMRKAAMGPAVRLCRGVAAVGQRAADFYRQAVGGRCPVASIPYYADVSSFRDSIRPGSVSSGQPVDVLFCGQLVERKGIFQLFQAMMLLMQSYDVRLTFLGRGELEGRLKAMIPAGSEDRFRFAGFRQTDELPGFFAAADIFVLPSLHDGWGVVVNQALAAGLPIVSTDAVGAAVDLVQDGVNGRIVPAGDESALHHALEELIQDPAKRVAWGLQSRKISDAWTPAEEARRWVCLLESVAGREQTGQ